jgi:sugar lactone lactonase YvrE
VKRSPLFVLAAVLLSVPTPVPAEERQIGDTLLFARIGEPGMPEGIAVGGGVVYVGTHNSVIGNAGGPPSKIFKFDVDTRVSLGEITVQGQDTSVTHGILGMEFGPDGALYVVDQNPGRILRIDPVTDAQTTYATIPDLATCLLGPSPGCAPGLFALFPTWANDLAFAPDGSMYVTDLQAATIFRVPPGGGAGEVWYQDARFDSYFGLNGIAVDPCGTKLYFAMTFSLQPTSPTLGIIYTLPLQAESPQPSDLQVFHTFAQPASGPDGIRFGASGKLYVALAGANQIGILNPDGSEAAIFPDPVTNLLLELDGASYDFPASVAFDGKGSLLVTNHPFFTMLPLHWTVLDVWVDDTAAP